MLGITESLASALLTSKIAEFESTIPEDEYEPATYQAALKSSQAQKWKEAMQQEWQALIENQTFDFVEQKRKEHYFHSDRDAETAAPSPQRSAESTAPSPQRSTESTAPSPQRQVRSEEFMEEPIGCKWIYRRKINPDGTTRYKARLVIKGYELKAGIDYDETYTPVSKLATFRLLLALAAQHDWNIDHMDVVTAFLNPKIDRDNICMSLPPGIEWLETTTIKAESLVLRKAL